jgi:hypothetical protein
MKNVKLSMILLVIGAAHFFNALPCIEKLDVGQTLEQVESIMTQRKTIKTITSRAQIKKQCVEV